MMLKTVFLLMTTGASVFWPISPDIPLAGSVPALISARDETHITNSSALDPFFRQLGATEARTRTRTLRIIQYGDSHTKADLFTGAVRKNLLRDFGGDVPRFVKQTTYKPASATGQLIAFQPLGINGARAKRLSDMSQSPGFLQSLAENKPDLIILAYGTNEVTDRDWTVDSYSRMLVGIITRLRSAAPEASFLILGPPDRSVSGSGGWASAQRMPLLLEAERRAAVTAGAAFWSEYDAMGGAGSMNVWVARGLGRFDHVHFTAVGYSKLAALFYTDLIKAYRGGRSSSPSNGTATDTGMDLRVMRGIPVSAKKPD
jgi:lysophospholipase L1-like esterase